jgi:hypothetical protein
MTFAQWQPRYAKHGVALIPCSPEKRPLVEHPQLFGCRGSTEIAAKPKFANVMAFGFYTGPRSRLTVLDVDTTDERVLRDALDRHGSTSLIVRTGSGKFHALYRHNGEKRNIRPWKAQGLPIDVLGAGLSIAPPSIAANGTYEIIKGSLDNLQRLPSLRELDASLYSRKLSPCFSPNQWAGMRQGDGRNRALWERCMRSGHGASLDRMTEIARKANQEFKEPMTEAEVVKVATSAWQHDSAGLNFFIRPRVMIDHDLIDHLPEDALLLLIRLDRYHRGNDRFALAKQMAASMGWSLARWRAARGALTDADVIRCVHPGGRGPHDPPIYGWAMRG